MADDYETWAETEARRAREQAADPIGEYIKELRSFAEQASKQANMYTRKADQMEAQYNELKKSQAGSDLA